MHMFGAEDTSFVTTWAHPDIQTICNTALFLNHLIAEYFSDLVAFVILYFPSRWWLRRHDRRKHGVK